MLERFFGLAEHGTDVRREIVAGATTFLTMAYIIVVNPAILSDTGMDFGAVFVATCVAAAIGTSVMGLYANYPIALAPGMGLNAYFAYAVVGGLGFSWQVALGAVFLSGVIFLVLSVLPVREWIINAIPKTLKMAISAGIGFFLAIIALKNAGVVVDNPATLVGLGNVTSASTILAGVGFVLMIALDYRRVPGAVLIGIIVISFIGMLLGISEFKGVASLPPNPWPTFAQLDIAGALQAGLVTIVFAFLFVDLFDSAGTLVGLAHRAGLLDENGRLPRLNRALFADSTATVAGSVLGTSTVTSYIESAAGIKAGGRTGLTAMTVAALFLLALFLSPLAQSVPSYATAPALLFVACLMARGLTEIDWDDATEYAPAVVTAISMPLTYSVADGIGLGFLTYVATKLLSGRFNQVSPAVLLIAVLFAARFALLDIG
ncbi:NCS2 family permease [Ferruginivarius sediminum]|uniref:NCS2 family permease n=1 Tax=Ferruginivarius sediminum TaxID=2661937 RepID=A0A369TBB2_9PROT|nr:NCS2 family permease [Ferruginivarius sediminum]RDD62142.1 NCS2 family permease [Ferruginivarius sediminum]